MKWTKQSHDGTAETPGGLLAQFAGHNTNNWAKKHSKTDTNQATCPKRTKNQPTQNSFEN